uniref:Dentin sialophosphoprotein n=1 Tax=Solanum tuberosum TaxID=4113 RepID=M1DPD2_SOLTU
MAARSSGESSQNHHQNRSTIEVIRDDSDIGGCNTGRGGRTIEASSIFHGGLAGSGDSAGIPSKNFENQYEEEMRVISQTQIQHREGKQQVQDLGQSSTSRKDEQLTTKQGKDTGIIRIDKSRSTVIHAHQAHLNAGIDRNENDQMKIWVAKDQGKESSSESTYSSSQVRDKEIHTAAEKELDGTRLNNPKEDSSQISGKGTGAKASHSQDVHNSQKSHDLTVPIERNPQATEASNIGRGGHNNEASSTFYGEIAGSGDSGGIPVKIFEKSQYTDEPRVSSDPHIQIREGKKHVQDLGQSNTSHMDEQFIKKQGKDTSIIHNANSRLTVFPANQAHLNSGTEHFRKENDQQKIWVAKDQGNTNTIKSTTRTDQQQVTDIGQQQGKFNNISGDRLSKKKREAIKKRLQQSIGKDRTRIDTGQQTEGYADAQVTEGNMAKMPPDDYGALNSEDDLDPDNQSLEDSDNEAADTQPHTSQVFGSSFKDKVTDVQRMTEQQGLSPRGRKQTRHNPQQNITSKSDSSSRPMTRSKSKGY